MGFRYHSQSIYKDVDTDDPFFGAGNLEVVRKALEEQKKTGFLDAELETAIDELAKYFNLGISTFSPEERQLARRQDLEGELLSQAEGQVLEQAKRRAAKAGHISKAEAKRLAKLITQKTGKWPD